MTNTVNIFDMLLGVVEATAKPQVVSISQTGTVGVPEVSFDMLLQGLIGNPDGSAEAPRHGLPFQKLPVGVRLPDGTIDLRQVPTTAPGNPQFQEATDQLAQFLGRESVTIDDIQAIIPVSEDEAAALQSGTMNLTRLVADVSENSKPQSISTPVPAEHEEPLRILPDQQNLSESGQKTLDNLLPRVQRLVAQPQQIVTSEKVDLQPGTYDILSAKASDGRLNLEIVDTGRQAERIIKISLPEAALDSEQIMPRTESSRVAVDGVRVANRVEKLLNKMNFTRLDVSKAVIAEAPTDETNHQTFKLDLTASQAGREVAFRAQVSKSEMPTVAVSKTPVTTVNPTTLESRPAAERVLEPANANVSQRVEVSFESNNGAAADSDSFTENFGARKDGFEMSKSAPKTTKIDPQALFTQTMKASASPTRPAAEVALPVRITIPQQSIRGLRPNGASVRLQIEPEHLGPARLSLTMQHETLRAQVVVDSQQAKIAVESSLDQLTSQLAKANIKVDYINVSVGDHGQEPWQFDRRPQWHQQAGHPHAGPEDASLESDVPAAPSVESQFAPPESSSLTAGGVNLLA